MLRRVITSGTQVGRPCGLALPHSGLSTRSLFSASTSTSTSASPFSSELPLEPPLTGDGGGIPTPGDGNQNFSDSATYRRNLRRPTTRRPFSDLERACSQMLWRRNPGEPIELTLQKHNFPLSPSNIGLVLTYIRSPRDALRLFLYYLHSNPSYVPERGLLDALSRFWKHERERFSVFLSILLELRTPSCNMTPRRLTTLLRGYGWAGLVDEVLHYLGSCEASYGFKPDFVHYSCAVHTCISERRLDVAMQIFDQMKKDGKEPTYDTFQSLISGLLDINQPGSAAVLFEEMVSSQLVTPGDLPGRVVSFVFIVNALLKVAGLDQAREFLMKINDLGYVPDYITCANVLKAFSKSSQVKELDELYDDFKAKHLLPDVDKLKSFVDKHCKGKVTLGTEDLLSSLVSTIDLVAYFRISNDEGGDGNPFPVPTIVVSSPSISGEGEDAAHIEASLTGSSPGEQVEDADVLLFDRVIFSLCVHEKPEDAFELLMRFAGDPECERMPSSCTSMILFDALCWISKWELAEQLLSMMMKWGHMPNLKVYNAWIQGSCKADRVESLCIFLNEFWDSKGELVMDALSHNLVVEKLCMAGKLDEAKKFTKELKSIHGTPDVVIYSRMIQSFAKAGDFDVPRKLLDEMVDLGITPFALPFTPLVQRLCHAGKIDEAVELVGEIEAKGCRPLPSLYTLIVGAYCKAKRLQDAFNVMDIMKAKGVTPEPQTHKDLFGCCMGSRELKSAVQA